MITISLASSADVPFLGEIEADSDATYATVPDSVPDVIEPRSEQFYSDAQQSDHVWVARAEGKPVGFALVTMVDGHPHLEQLSVLRAQQQQGIGAQLLRTVTDWVRTMGYGEITLTTFRDVSWNQPFYEKHGFVAITEFGPELSAQWDREHEEGFRKELRNVMQWTPLPS